MNTRPLTVELYTDSKSKHDATEAVLDGIAYINRTVDQEVLKPYLSPATLEVGGYEAAIATEAVIASLAKNRISDLQILTTDRGLLADQYNLNQGIEQFHGFSKRHKSILLSGIIAVSSSVSSNPDFTKAVTVHELGHLFSLQFPSEKDTSHCATAHCAMHGDATRFTHQLCDSCRVQLNQSAKQAIK